jgi:MFS family permease
MFIEEPFDFSEKYLGTLDMTVLFTIAILLNIFGGKVERHPRRKLLFIMMISLICNLLILFVLMLMHVTSKPTYFVFYTTTGVLSCLAWPICLYVFCTIMQTVSQYFDSSNPTALSMWSSVSQCGDFIAFLITLIVIESETIDGAYSMLILSLLFMGVLCFDYFFFRDRGNQQEQSTAVKDV